MARLAVGDVACWLLKSAGWPADLSGPGSGPQRMRRCLRRTYRLGLMAPGQPCLLWVSGARRPGVVAVGRLAGVPGPDDAVDVELVPLAAQVHRSDLLGDGRFLGSEVIRMPAGSNPSYLTRDELAAVLDAMDDSATTAWGVTPPRAVSRRSPGR